MSEITLSRDARLTLRAQAHHLNPVVLLGASGLTEAVMKEIDRELKAHELIKVRVPTDDREEREAIFVKIADELGCARVETIELLVFDRFNFKCHLALRSHEDDRIAFALANERTSDRRRDRNEVLLDVGFIVAHDLIGDV